MDANMDLITKLKFLGLDIENIPDYLRDFSPLNFSISRLNNDKDYRVYRYIPIDKIEILLTPCLRSDDIRDKYSKAIPLGKFFNSSGDPNDIERYAQFLKIINTLSVEEIQNVEKVQNELEEEEPFKVKYARDFLWQIYYAPATHQYFMLVCTKEETFAEFFYLLKKIIEFKNNKKLKVVPKVYVPINYINYSEQYLNRDEIANIENYLWLLTKNWALIFEVYNNDDEMSLQVVGETYVYNNVKSTYKVKLTDKNSSLKFYKLIKALFILQTEIKNKFEFQTKIDSKNSLELYYNETQVTYESLEEFIENQYKIAKKQIEIQNGEIFELEGKLKNLKEAVSVKETEYLQKQKEISTYLEYRRTFFGKVKYFFKGTKKIAKSEDRVKRKETQEVEVNRTEEDIIEEKKFYTIEDLVFIYAIKDKKEKVYKDLVQDIKALELKLENLKSKVRNADIYIAEIDSHKKSIFEFWKFANKDEKLTLEMGDDNSNKNDHIALKKSFDFEMDFEELGIEVDRLERIKLSKEETDSIYIAGTELNAVVNTLRTGNMNKTIIENSLNNLKSEFNKNRLYMENEVFDIFGNIDNDNRKVKYIGSRSHRENEKSKFRILNINKKIDVFDYTEKILSIISYIEGAFPKIISKYDMSIYKVTSIATKLEKNNFEVFDLNVENALSNFDDTGEGAVNLIKLNYKEGMPLLYYSNIIFFDNSNKTLPEGMDMSTRVLIDCKKFNFTLVKKSKFRTNNYLNEQNGLTSLKSKDVLVYEYNVEYKQEQVKQEKIERVQVTPSDKEKDILGIIDELDDEGDEELEREESTELDEKFGRKVAGGKHNKHEEPKKKEKLSKRNSKVIEGSIKDVKAKRNRKILKLNFMEEDDEE